MTSVNKINLDLDNQKNFTVYSNRSRFFKNKKKSVQPTSNKTLAEVKERQQRHFELSNEKVQSLKKDLSNTIMNGSFTKLKPLADPNTTQQSLNMKLNFLKSA